MRVMIVVTHLLGTGHLSRAITLGRAFAEAGHTVTLVSGGRAVPHLACGPVSLVQLPAVASDGTDFTRLLDIDGQVVSDALLKQRQTVLRTSFDEAQPDVLITELFPFGRRILRLEFRHLLERARGQCLILASVRDILAPPGKPEKVAFADDTIAQFYDGILVHSDPDVIALSQSWPVSNTLSDRLHYTGFVAPPPVALTDARTGPVVVSAGGGNVGDALFDAALRAAIAMPDTNWHMVVGGNPTRRTAFAQRAPANVVVEGLRPDFRHMMARARASVSMCGYNTAMDTLQTGVPAVFVPFDDGGEQEQTLRAKALSRMPALTYVAHSALSGAKLEAAIKGVMAQSRAPLVDSMNGAYEAVHIATRMAEGRHVGD